jgi:hypothetical protein
VTVRLDDHGLPTQPTALLGPAALAAAVAVAVAVGLGAGRDLAPQQPAPAVTTRIVRAGAASLVVPSAWRSVDLRGAGVPGLPRHDTVVFAPSPELPGRAAVTMAAADDPSLLPSALRAALRAPAPRPTATEIAGRRAWLYSRLVTGPNGQLTDVTVLPTTAGVLAVLCTSPAAAWSAVSECAASVGAIFLRGGATLAPSADLALQMRLPGVVSRLDQIRVRGRAALWNARTPADQAHWARLLAREHRAAASSLRPLAPRSRASLLERLSSAGRAYAALARAARAGSTHAFAVARLAVDRAESGLVSELDSAAAPRGVPAPS